MICCWFYDIFDHLKCPTNTTLKQTKESTVSSECLKTLETNIINNVNSLKDEIICLKVALKDYKKKMKEFVKNANNWKTEWLLSNLPIKPLSNTVGGII